jgi:prepilin-type processing-associated H-X9-DG protein
MALMPEGDVVNVYFSDGHVILEGETGAELQHVMLKPDEARELGNALIEASEKSAEK